MLHLSLLWQPGTMLRRALLCQSRTLWRRGSCRLLPRWQSSNGKNVEESIGSQSTFRENRNIDQIINKLLGKDLGKEEPVVEQHSGRKGNEQHIMQVQRDVRDLIAEHSHEEALEGIKHLKTLVSADYGEDHPVFAAALNDQGLVFKEMNNYEQAAEVLLKALGIYRASVGEDSVSYAAALHNLGMTYKAKALAAKGVVKAQTLEQAYECLKESLRIREKTYDDPDENLEVLNTRRNLATVDFRRGNKEEAIQELSQILVAVRTSKRGPRSLEVATTVNDLGFLYKEAGVYDKAVEAYEEAFSIRREKLGLENPSTVTTEWNLAVAYGAMGDVEKQRTMSEHILKRFGHSENDIQKD